MKTYIALYILITLSLGLTSTFAAWANYSKTSTIEDLCRVAFNGEVDFNKGCVFDENLSDEELLGNVTFDLKWKELSSSELMSLLDTAIVNKYKKLWYKEGTAWMVKAKSRLYDALFTKIGNDYWKDSIQNNSLKRELYSGLYLALSVSKIRNWNEYAEAIKTSQIEATKNNEEKNTGYKENYQAAVSQEWFMSTGIDQADIDRIMDAKHKAWIEDYQSLTDYEKQARRFDVVYDWVSPSYDIHEVWLQEVHDLIEKVEQGPKLTWYIWMQNGLIYWDIVDSYNIYLWTLIDGWLVKYQTELVKETAFFRDYVWPFYWDSDWQWRNWTTRWQNAEKVLGYFWYKIELDPLSPNYLELSYDETMNQARWKIDYIENIWK